MKSKNYSLECVKRGRGESIEVYDNEMNFVCSHKNLDEFVRKAMFFDKLFKNIIIGTIVEEHKRVEGESYNDDYDWMRLVLEKYLKTGIIEDKQFDVLLVLYSQKKIKDMIP